MEHFILDITILILFNNKKNTEYVTELEMLHCLKNFDNHGLVLAIKLKYKKTPSSSVSSGVTKQSASGGFVTRSSLTLTLSKGEGIACLR